MKQMPPMKQVPTMKQLLRINTKYLGVNFALFTTYINRNFTMPRAFGCSPTVMAFHWGRLTLALRFGRFDNATTTD